MDGLTQFWGTAIGGAIVAAIVAGVVALRHGNWSLPGVTLKDFPGVSGVSHPLQDVSVNAALHRAVGGWRVLWVIVVSGLVMGSVNAAWYTALPPAWHAESFAMTALRGVVVVTATFWVVGRLLVASIHRHLGPAQRRFEAAS